MEPDNTFEFDLDARLAELDAARGEAQRTPRVIVFRAHRFELPPDLPWSYAEYSLRGESHLALRAALGDDAYEELLAVSPPPGVNEIREFMKAIGRLYGQGSMGESAASPRSSPANGSASRPTSNGSTGSSLPRRSSGRAR